MFVRTGERRYAIRVQRPGEPDVEMDPAPGYDPLLPHDLLHLVVEAELGLAGGVFGQLAAGGLAGTFRVVAQPGLSRREASRLRRHADARDGALLKAGREDAARSERAAFLCWYEWLVRSAHPDCRQQGGHMAAQAAEIRAGAPAEELDALSAPVVDRICGHLSTFSERWRGLEIGQAVTLLWPGLAIDTTG